MSELIDLQAELDASKKELLESVAGLNDKQACEHAPECWSALGCLEHLGIVERRWMGRIAEAPADHENVADGAKEAAILRSVSNREQRFKGPEAVQPKGKFSSISEGINDLVACREDAKRAIAGFGDQLVRKTVQHPVIGDLNGREAVIVMSAHWRRHAAQIREIRAKIEEKATAQTVRL